MKCWECKYRKEKTSTFICRYPYYVCINTNSRRYNKIVASWEGCLLGKRSFKRKIEAFVNKYIRRM